MFSNDIHLRLPVVLIFGLIGYLLARQVDLPHTHRYTVFLILGVLVLLSFIGNDPWPVTLGGMLIPLKTVLSGAVIGLLAGIVIHERTHRQ